MSNGCEEFQGLIAAALYGPLRPEEQARLQSHLSGCDDCRCESEALKGTVQLLGRPESEPADVQRDAFAVAIRRKLGKKTLRPVAARGPAWVIPAPLAAAALLVVVGVILYPRPRPVDIAVRPPDVLPAPKPPPRLPEPPAPEIKPPAPAPVVPAPLPEPGPEVKPPTPEPQKPAPEQKS